MLLFISGAIGIFSMAFINGAEWIIVILIIVILFFGARKIPELAKSLGRATSEFQKARIDAKRNLQSDLEAEPQYAQQQSSQQSLDREKLESIADTLGIDYSNKNDLDLKNSIEEEIKKTKQ
ncbi:MAG: twin-arginine translocase TatA/TatE family subunit [Thermoproteota archaeon]|nr:twin-arginine translocase TatA/TatE family subunit [Thermoproteota archaeon]